MHVAVIGAGNMGCLYGANLARVGVRVTMIDVWPEHVAAMATEGIRMSGLNGDFVAKVGAASQPAGVAAVDVAIVLVNTYATEAAAHTAEAILAEDGFVLSLQNGLGNIETLSQVLGAPRVMPGLSFHSADLEGPGRVRHTNRGPTYLGEVAGGSSPRLEQLGHWLNQAEMDPVIEEDIIATIWGKFVHNCAINALCALTELRPGHIGAIPEMDHFQERIIAETLALVRAKGIAIPSADPMGEIKAYCATKFHRVSMLQHLQRGRQTEIDALNGYVVHQSRELGLPCPYNEALTALVKGRQFVPDPPQE